jgi:hypothetical protein
MVPIIAICFHLIIIRSSWLHNDLSNSDLVTTTIAADHDPMHLPTSDLQTTRRTPHVGGILDLTAPEFEDIDSKVSGGALRAEDQVRHQSTMSKKDIVVTPTRMMHTDDVD